MRPKVVIPVLLFGMASFLAVYLLHPRQSKVLPATSQAESAAAVVAERTAISNRHKLELSAAADRTPNLPVGDEETHEDYVSRRIAELMDMAMTDDPNSLATILSELTNSDGQIRNAAVNAAIQFKSADAIPALQEAYNRSDDPQEKTRIAGAIEFLSIPNESQFVE